MSLFGFFFSLCINFDVSEVFNKVLNDIDSLFLVLLAGVHVDSLVNEARRLLYQLMFLLLYLVVCKKNIAT